MTHDIAPLNAGQIHSNPIFSENPNQTIAKYHIYLISPLRCLILGLQQIFSGEPPESRRTRARCHPFTENQQRRCHCSNPFPLRLDSHGLIVDELTIFGTFWTPEWGRLGGWDPNFQDSAKHVNYFMFPISNGSNGNNWGFHTHTHKSTCHHLFEHIPWPHISLFHPRICWLKYRFSGTPVWTCMNCSTLCSIQWASRLIWSVKKHKRVVPEATIIGVCTAQQPWKHMHAFACT